MTRIFLVILVCLSLSVTVRSQVEANDIVFEKVDVEADYPGGIQAWRKFLEENLDPSVPVDNGAPVGRYIIYVQFIVDRDGRISEIKPLTKEGYGMEQEVVRIMRKSVEWVPAKQGGRTVRAYRKQPVTFMVQEDGFDIHTATPFTLFTDTDNEIDIDLDRKKPGDLDVSISQGTIRYNGNGKFIVRVTRPGRVLITVSNRKKKKSRPSVMSLEVRKKEP